MASQHVRIGRSDAERAPRVSIGIPVYNGENYLAAALDCLLGQTFRDLEVVITDNASTDRTEEICREFAALDARVRYHRAETNLGAAANYRRCFELSRGEFFKWQAHDDLCSSDFIERCVAELDRDPEAIWCHSRRAEIDEQGRRIPLTPHTAAVAEDAATSQAKACAAATPHERFHVVLFAYGASLDLYGVGRRAVLAKTGLHYPYYGGDKVFMVELALLGKWLQIPEPLFFMRRHPDQSAWIPTARGQEQWIAGGHASRLRPPRQVRCTIGYVELLLKSPISLMDRMRCLAAVIGYVTNGRKWRRLGQDVLRATGFQVRVPEDALRPTRKISAGEGDKRLAGQKG